MTSWQAHAVQVPFDGGPVRIAYAERAARRGAETVLYLHGLGSSGRDFRAAAAPELAGARLLALDLPGCGGSPAAGGRPPGIPGLARLVEATLDAVGLDAVHLVGHSMGGLVGLLVADRAPRRIRTFTSVEGNLAPVDCRVFSRRVVELAASRPADRVVDLVARELAGSRRPGLATFAARFRSEVRPEVFVDYCRSIVQVSDGRPLLRTFRDLRRPRLFVYGEANRDLPYLAELERAGVELAGIPGADHFPLYTNPRRFFQVLGGFLDRHAGAGGRPAAGDRRARCTR